jgi:hypothetical protein
LGLRISIFAFWHKTLLRRLFLFFLILLGLAVAFFIRSPQFSRCVFLKDYYLRKVTPFLYVDKSLSEEQIEQLVQHEQQARKRIEELFGRADTQPCIIAGEQAWVMQLFGNPQIETGMTHLSPIGAYIVLGADGLNVDVVSHELCHAQLMQEVGWWMREFYIPTWFDEGLAMQVDNRFPNWETEWRLMTLNGKTAPELEQMARPSDFFNHQTYINYLTAKKQVQIWHELVGQDGLRLFIETLKSEKNFNRAFHAPLKKVYNEALK